MLTDHRSLITDHRSPVTSRWAWRLTALAALLLAGLVIGGLVFGFVRTATRVTVTVDGMPAVVYTHLHTVGELLEEMQIDLRPEDRLLTAPETPLQSGLAIEIRRARPVLLDEDGRVNLLYTQATTLADVFASAGVAASQHDLISIGGQPAMVAAALPARSITGGRNLPGVPGVYPWRGTQIEPLAVVVRHAAPLTVQVGALEWTVWTTASTVGGQHRRRGPGRAGHGLLRGRPGATFAGCGAGRRTPQGCDRAQQAGGHRHRQPQPAHP